MANRVCSYPLGCFDIGIIGLSFSQRGHRGCLVTDDEIPGSM